MRNRCRPQPLNLGDYSRRRSSVDNAGLVDSLPRTPCAVENPFSPVNCSRTEIIPSVIYLGGEAEALNDLFLKRHGIEAIITLNNTILPRRLQHQMNWLKQPIPDLPESNILPTLHNCISFMNDCTSQNKTVLVHCQRGISRSATVVIAFLMKYKHISLMEAFDHVKVRRPMIDPNFGFLMQLQQFERDYIALHIQERIDAGRERRSSIDEDGGRMRQRTVGSLRRVFE